MSAAAVELQPHDEIPAAGTPVLLRQQAAEVLAAHRSRRQRIAADHAQSLQHPVLQSNAALPSRSRSIASRVTERYSQSQSYRAFLAAQAEEAIHKANAAAEVAARTAHAVAEAQQELLKELADAEACSANSSVTHQARQENPEIPQYPEIQESPRIREQTTPNLFLPSVELSEEQPAPPAPISRASLTVRLFEDSSLISRGIAPTTQHIAGHARHDSLGSSETATFEETQALDEEISFRQAPTFDLERSSVAIPGNLLEFPRQLVAARKARPRYAEGPLGAVDEHPHDEAQLRIFEVQEAQITAAPPAESSSPEWSSIWLDALAPDTPDVVPEASPVAAKPPIEAASLERRVMAAIVDTCLVGMAFVAFATTFAYNAPVLPSLTLAAMASAVSLAAMFVLYQTLFFTLSEATPGMRYARIGLCTFADENPTRTAMLGRMLATLLAACPLGLGLLWACLDDDRLGWHDRLSGMYQRSY